MAVRRAGLLLVVVALGLVANAPAAARGQAYCDDGQEITPGAAFTALVPLLVDVIGAPFECEHAGPQGDLLQQTSTGLAFMEASSGSPNFTNGAEHWAVIDGELAYRIDVAAEAPPQPAPAPEPLVADQPVVPQGPPNTPAAPAPGLFLLAWQDLTADLNRPYLYVARRRCTYTVEAFERASTGAAVVITYNPNLDDPLDKPNQVRLVLAWPGVAGTRTTAGAVAIAQLGATIVHWTSYTDRVVQDVILLGPPSAARLDEQLNGSGIFVARDQAGGYLVTDVGSGVRFFVRAPTVVDARGLSRPATLTWNFPAATIALDPVFMNSATYPVTVSMTAEFGTVYC